MHFMIVMQYIKFKNVFVEENTRKLDFSEFLV
jgi:hypothetical protein